MNTKYKNLLFDADQTLIDFEKDMPLAFQYMYEQSGLAKQKPYSSEILRLYNDCNESWWRRFEQKLAPKRSCTATVSSISSRSRGSHRSASIFCKTCMSPA